MPSLLRNRAIAQLVLPKPVKELIEATGLPIASFGLHIQPIGRAAKPLVSLNAETPFQMASTTKLVTSLAALDLLGPEYRWRTHAFLDGTLHEQRLLGDLIIVGGGDASLSSDAHACLVRRDAGAWCARGMGRYRARPVRVQPE